MKYVTAIMTAPHTGQVLRSEVYDLEDLAEARMFQRDQLIMAIACADNGWTLCVIRTVDKHRDRCAVAPEWPGLRGGASV